MDLVGKYVLGVDIAIDPKVPPGQVFFFNEKAFVSDKETVLKWFEGKGVDIEGDVEQMQKAI